MAKLVTGGMGYIGSETVRQLVNRGEEVVVFDTVINRYRIEDIEKKLSIVRGDLGNFNEVLNLFRENKFDAVYHMGSMLSYASELDPWAAFRSNILGTYHVLEAARLLGMPKVMFTSTQATYGLGIGEVVDDGTIQRPLGFYGVGKLYGEGLGRWYSSKFGLDFRSVRYALMIGPNVHTPGHWAPPMIEDAIMGKPNTCRYGNPDSAGSWIYINDAAKAAIDLLDAPKEKIETRNYNVTGIPEVISTMMAETYLKKRYPGFHVTYQADPALVAMGARRRMRSPVKVFSDSYARKEWGWKPNFATLEAIVTQFEKDMKSNPKRYGFNL
ncbi:MAG TPA: NAD-dependent epimerase/dehydratase family protein [Thermodesulfobacteriota bacterium]|nr:NAD-dependent epimerase/dehydratase family protein [Thermodesulfobacteriota bacterium]